MQKIFNRYFAIQILLFTTFIFMWHLLAVNYHNPYLLPSPLYVITISFPGIALYMGYTEPSFVGAIAVLSYNSTITIFRMVIGLIIGILFGIIYGLLIHYYRRSRYGNVIVLSFIRAIPLFALIPLFLQWFGGNDIGLYVYISFAIFVVIASNTYQSIFNINPSLLQQARLLGANRFQAYRTVVLPAILPELLGGIRVIIGLSWAFSLGAEFISGRNGLGYILFTSYLYADMGKMIILGFLYSILGMVGYYLSMVVFKFITRWN